MKSESKKPLKPLKKLKRRRSRSRYVLFEIFTLVHPVVAMIAIVVAAVVPVHRDLDLVPVLAVIRTTLITATVLVALRIIVVDFMFVSKTKCYNTLI